MNGMNWDELTPAERLLAEQAVMNFRTLNKACRSAADGQVLDVAETLAMQQGRELIRKTLAASLEEEGRQVEKRGAESDVLVRIEQDTSWLEAARGDHSGRRHSARTGVLPLCEMPERRIRSG